MDVTNPNELKLYDLVPMTVPGAVLDEAHHILESIAPQFDYRRVDAAFDTISRLYRGEYPHYLACSTRFHDLQHTTDVFLAMTRLLHGAYLAGHNLSEQDISVGMVAALLHDAGYIQRDSEAGGTGGKFTMQHVQRSIEFMGHTAADYSLDEQQLETAACAILATDMATTPCYEHLPGEGPQLVTKLLAAADLLGQMADRTYLEKLLFLYHEFKEGGVPGFNGEVDLLSKTVAFIDIAQRRLDALELPLEFLMRLHFQHRWDIDDEPYIKGIARNRAYLSRLLELGEDPRKYLVRGGIVDKVRETFGEHH